MNNLPPSLHEELSKRAPKMVTILESLPAINGLMTLNTSDTKTYLSQLSYLEKLKRMDLSEKHGSDFFICTPEGEVGHLKVTEADHSIMVINHDHVCHVWADSQNVVDVLIPFYREWTQLEVVPLNLPLSRE